MDALPVGNPATDDAHDLVAGSASVLDSQHQPVQVDAAIPVSIGVKDTRELPGSGFDEIGIAAGNARFAGDVVSFRIGGVELTGEIPAFAAILADAATDARTGRIVIAIGAENGAGVEAQQFEVRALERRGPDRRPALALIAGVGEDALAGQMLADHGQKPPVIEPDNIDIAVVALRIGGDDHRRGKMVAVITRETDARLPTAIAPQRSHQREHVAPIGQAGADCWPRKARSIRGKD